jgi:electron transport complex protein RnfE
MHSEQGTASSKRYGLIPLALAALPALAVAVSGLNGLLIGGSALISMALASLLLSLVWKFVPAGVRGFALVLFAATAASMAQMVVQVALPRVSEALGLYLPLVAFTCALTGLPDAYDVDHELEDSLVRSVIRGTAYLAALTAIGCIREVLGAGAIFGISLGASFQPMRMLVMAPGALMLAGLILALLRAVQPKHGKGEDGA